MNLTDREKEQLKAMIDAGQPLPPRFKAVLFEQPHEAELIWPGKTHEVTNVVLPFQSIEQIDEPRAGTQAGTTDLFAFDQGTGRQTSGWTNKLIWGDNKLVLASLKNGPLRREIEAAGGLKLVYIDPPFDVGADFSMEVEVGDNEGRVTKSPSVIEEVAYRDTWGRGADSFMSMIYERLSLIQNLLHEGGTIYVHCDWRVNALIRLALNELFGSDNFINEVTWKRAHTVKGNIGQGSKYMGANTDTLLVYTKSKSYTFNNIFLPYSQSYINTFFKYYEPGTQKRYRLVSMIGPGGAGKGNPHYEVMGVTRYWRYSETTMKSLIANGLVVQTSPGTVPQKKQYLDDGEGVSIQTLWDDITGVAASSNEGTDYPTQKPEALLQRVLTMSSNPGDLVADFFCGSGTTLAVAEKLGRKWIGCDVTVHTPRVRPLPGQGLWAAES